MHTLRHPWRKANLSAPGQQTKSMMSSQNVLSVHNHWPTHFVRSDVHIHDVDPAIARMLHHKPLICADPGVVCKPGDFVNPVRDDTIARFADELTARVRTTLEVLGIATSAAGPQDATAP
jgi:hypothetical protein